MPSKPKRVLYTLVVVVAAAAIIWGCFWLINSISQDMHSDHSSGITSSQQNGEQ